MRYNDFFKKATEFAPYLYQTRLAEGDALPILLKIPTGAGKTEAAVLGWLYRYFEHPNRVVRDSTQRRLAYCLPMRTLVEQTAARVGDWLENLDMADDVGVVTLMGGEPRTQWYFEPEKPFIIIGTQDMLLSRALNRGYGMGYNMWPIEYGLLNNDCLWVMDEVQLMANGLPTSTQLAGLRRKLDTFGPAHSMWMSATVRPDWLATIDHREPSSGQVLELGATDLADAGLSKRQNARKVVTEIFPRDGRQYPREMAKLIKEKHQPGTLTLAIVNTVNRAQEIYEASTGPRPKATVDAEIVLVHSRFRGADRKQKHETIAGEVDSSGPGRIIVSTQAVEAGVDISARTLITELAPWASLVQRFGRCNRKGEFEQGDVLWLDMGSKNTAPYSPEEVSPARELMKSLEGRSVGPADLEELDDTMGDPNHLTVIRRRDVVGLFDTTPDLSGSYLDVSQYVRGIDEHDVSVFWRHITDDGPDQSASKPLHSETVSVPIGGVGGGSKGVKDYLDSDNRRAWRWDFLDDEWRPIEKRDIHPGMTLMLDASQGGYSTETGWTYSDKTPVEPVALTERDRGPEDGQSSDLNSTSQKNWVTLGDHTRHVCSEVNAILGGLTGLLTESDIREALAVAALYHDAGKAHPAFQEMLRQNLPEGENPPGDDVQMAKSPGRGRFGDDRRHFRHELGSALAILEHAGTSDEKVRDLAAYLAAAHHGKVRVGIRSLPGKRVGNRDSNPDPNQLLGYRISGPEILPPVDLGNGLRLDETTLDLSVAWIGLSSDGRRSWLERSLALLDRLGSFRLAYLEAIIRAADMRTSKKEQEAVH